MLSVYKVPSNMNGINASNENYINGHDKSELSSDEIPTLVYVDPTRPGEEQENIHTRWHPDIPCISTIPINQAFQVQCLDYSGGQIPNTDNADDVLNLDHDSDHHLSGPFKVEGTKEGDVLEIEILYVKPFDNVPWGYCVTAPGLGSLDDHTEGNETKVIKSIWDFKSGSTSSRHVPHVSFRGRPHVGVVGTAPSHLILSEWTRRESQLEEETDGKSGCSLPLVKGAYVGQKQLNPGLREKIYKQGARTGPGREHGGNIDIPQLTKGSKVYLPVYIEGASLSIGDLHYCQSDGEPTTAIEMAGIVTLKVNIIKDGVKKLGLKSIMYKTSLQDHIYMDRLVFTGLSVDLISGNQTDQSGIVAYRNAAFQAISYLQSLGYTREQAYILLSAAPIDTRVTATANKPNFVVSLGIPVDIFDFNIDPRVVADSSSSARERRIIAGPALPTVQRVNGHGNGKNGH